MVFRARTLNRAVAVFLAVFSLTMLWVAYHPERPSGKTWATDAMVYPKGILFLLLICSVIFFLQRAEKGEAKIEKIPSLLAVYATFIGYSLALPHLGFLLATFLWVSLMAWMAGEKRGWMAILIGFLGTAASYLIFWVVLRVPFPEGKIIGLERFFG